MTRALPVVLLALLVLVPAPAAAQSEAARILETPSSVEALAPTRFVATDPLAGPELLADVAFEEGSDAWVLDGAGEIGGEVARTSGAGPGVARVSAGPATRAGTVYLVQRVDVQAERMEFAVRARVVDGDVARFAFLVREEAASGERDHVFFHNASASWGDVVQSFTPASDVTSVRVLLRAELLAGMRATVEFAEPSLRAAPRALAWDFDADGRPDAQGSRATFAFPSAGARTVRLLVDGVPTDSRSVTVAPPTATFGLDRNASGWYVDAWASRVPGAREWLRPDAWALDAQEVGGVTRLDANGSLSLSVQAERKGSAYVWQGVRPPGGALDFRVEVADTLGHAGYAIVLREVTPASTKDIVLEGPPSHERQVLAARWTPSPQASVLYVQLRALFDENASSSTLHFANASLRTAVRHEWAFDGRALAEATPRAPWPVWAQGAVNVSLRVFNEAGTSSVVKALSAPSAFDGRVLGPVFVNEGVNATWSTHGLRDWRQDRVVNGGFDGGLYGWAFDASEVDPGAVARTVEGEHGLAARIDYESLQNGTLFLVQPVEIRNATTYHVTFARRDEGALRYDVLLRETGFSQGKNKAPLPWHDTLWTLPSTPSWDVATLSWKSRYNDSTTLLVHLRVSAFAGDGPATVWFDNVTVQPARDVRWHVLGQEWGRGATFTARNLTQGEHALGVTVRSGGTPVAFETPVVVVPNGSARVFPSVAGGTRAVWDIPESPWLAHVQVVRDNATLRLDGTRGAWVDPSPVEGSPVRHRLEAVDVWGATSLLNEGTFMGGEFARILSMDPPQPTRGDEVRVFALSLDPEIVSLELQAGRDRVRLQPTPSGVWEGTWRIGPFTAGPAALAFEAATADGREGRIDSGEVHVSTFRGTSTSPDLPWWIRWQAAAVGAAVLLVGFAWGDAARGRLRHSALFALAGLAATTLLVAFLNLDVSFGAFALAAAFALGALARPPPEDAAPDLSRPLEVGLASALVVGALLAALAWSPSVYVKAFVVGCALLVARAVLLDPLLAWRQRRLEERSDGPGTLK